MLETIDSQKGTTVVPRPNASKKLLLKDLLKSRRIDLGLTQRDVARAMGLTALDYIGMVESGIRRLDLDRLPAIAKALDLDLDLLVEMTFRETYGSAEGRWLIDILYSHDRVLARRLSKLSINGRKSVEDVIDMVEDDENRRSNDLRMSRAS